MHENHGAVRGDTDEIHVKDSEWSHVLCAGSGHIRDKDLNLARIVGTAGGSFGSVSY